MAIADERVQEVVTVERVFEAVRVGFDVGGLLWRGLVRVVQDERDGLVRVGVPRS